MEMNYPKTIVLRHKRENLKKCSLRGLENRADFSFYTYPGKVIPKIDNYILLSLDAPPLTEADCQKGLFIVDATWRYAEKMIKFAESGNTFEYRSIPAHYRTAYPRRQDDCIDPERGLASIEAIYLAYKLLGREAENLLDHYHWKEQFLTLNNLSIK